MKTMFFTTQKTKATGRAGIILLLIGIPFLIVSGQLGATNKRKINTFTQTSGVVSEVVSYTSRKGSFLYKPVISFDDGNGTTLFSPSTGSNPASHAVGDVLELYYDPSGIEKPILNDWAELWLLPMIFGVVGGIITFIGGFLTYSQLKMGKKLAWVKINGQAIETTYSGVQLYTAYKVNGKSPYIIESQWVDPKTGRVVVFESDYLWFNPEQFLTPKQTIAVRIYPEHPDFAYSMDISFLPKAE